MTPGSFTVSVNISARQLVQPDFVDEVLAIIGESGVEPSEIVLEMTETSMLQDSATTRAKLQDLRDAGIGVSIDDFGTGYSSLSYLQRFPVTTLKIARDFVDVDGVDADAWELANAIVALGRALQLSVIAEGVEQWSQLGRLRTLGCEFAQGFYFARPLDPVVDRVAAGPRRRPERRSGPRPGAGRRTARTDRRGRLSARRGADRHVPFPRSTDRYFRPIGVSRGLRRWSSDKRGGQIGCRSTVCKLGKPVERRGRKARDLPGARLPKTARLPGTAHRRT